MRTMVLGAVLGVVVVLAVMALAGPSSEALAQRPTPQQAESTAGLIALSMPSGTERQVVTVIDPRGRAMSVYHVELSTGEITLKSVRNIQWDLQMMDFNGTNPLPKEIRAVLESKQP
jgi:hypothetical protein